MKSHAATVKRTARDRAQLRARLKEGTEVGSDGGFILGSGCSVPADVKPENFGSMIETAKR